MGSSVVNKDNRVAGDLPENRLFLSPESDYQYTDNSIINITNELPENVMALVSQSLDMGQGAMSQLATQVTQPAIEQLENQLSDQFGNVESPFYSSVGSLKKSPLVIIAIAGIGFYLWKRRK